MMRRMMESSLYDEKNNGQWKEALMMRRVMESSLYDDKTNY